MSTPAPALVVNCEIVEVEPAVFDAQGVCIKPPLLRMPQEFVVPLDLGYAVNDQGEQLSFEEAGIDGPPETLDEWTARQEQAAVNAEVAAQTAEGAAWVELRMIRDRWLAQTDYIEVYLSGGFSPLPQAVQDAITANGSDWQAWRQALRDLPSLVGTAGTPSFDPASVVADADHIHATSDTFPAPWPQPPAAPVIHLT